MKLDKISLKWKLFSFICILSITIIIIFGVFQILLLETVYRAIKIKGIDSVATDVITLSRGKNLSGDFSEDEYFYQQIDTLSSENEISIYFIRKQEVGTYCDYTSTYSTKNGGINLALIDTKNIAEIWNKAIGAGFVREKFFIVFSENEDSRFNIRILADNTISTTTSIICGSFINDNEGVEHLLILDTRLTPVQPAVDTLKIQLIYIALIVIIITLAVALGLSKYISQPIVKMNESAKCLAKGRYDIKFEGKGYLEIEELNKTLNYAVEELKKTETLQRELLANVSHDLKTPLTLITGYAEMIRDLPSENTKENVQVIVDEANRLSTLVKDLLSLSRITSKTEQLNKQKYNISDSIQMIVNRQAKFLEHENFEILFDNPGDVYVYADISKIEQVIYNFITNAINYSGTSKKIKVIEEVINNEVKVSIQDFGVGIKKDDLDVIWDRYYRVDKGHIRAQQGSGLGLSIIKGILDYHEFKYGVESTVGEGSIFYFIMPII